MNKYYLPIMLLIVVAVIGLSAKPSWVIHRGTNPAELGARVTDIENNLDTNKTTLDTITTAVITSAGIATANITTANITTATIATGTIKAGDSLKTSKLVATAGTIKSGDSLISTLAKATRLRGTLIEVSDTTKPLCIGDSGTNGSFRFIITGDSMFLQHRETGAWNRCAAWAP